MAERGAGASAQARADQQRADAERLLASAGRWERGAQGEAAVAAVLRGLPPIYTVLHDLQVPGSRANIDHLVIGPAGVFVVDAKHWSQPLRVSDGMIWRGRYPIRKELEVVTWEARQAAAALGVPVHPMLCFVGSHLPTPTVDLGPVRATTDTALVAAICAGTAGYDITDISRITLLAHRHLPRAGQAPAASRSTHRSPATRPRPRRRKRTSTPRHHTPKPRNTHRGTPPLLGPLASLVVAGVLLLNAPTISRALSDLVEQFLPDAATTAGPAPSAPPVSINGDFSCPAAGAGWALTFAWPGDGPAGGYELATSSDLTNWTPLASWTSSAQTAPRIDGVAPGAAVHVRAIALAAGATPPPTVGTFRSPSSSC